MLITIYSSGIPFNGETINHKSLGGSESAAYYVAKELAQRGHDVVVFTEEEGHSESDGVRYFHVGQKTEEAPLGTDYHFYVTNTPIDVCIVQRHPGAFVFPTHSKLNLLWSHDIALKRADGMIMTSMMNVDALMPVSEWFKNQICDTWTVSPDIVKPIHNGVDYSLFDQFDLKDNTQTAGQTLKMIYSSRPERGLENLVKPEGIMEKLHKRNANVELLVCGYEHGVPQLEGYYGMLRERIDLLPNCKHIGALTKEELYRLLCEEVDMWVYPTEFEEVSCITAMECMAAGLAIVTTKEGALPETIGNYQNATMFKKVDIDRFVDYIYNFQNKFRRNPKRDYTWARATDDLERVIAECFDTRKDSDAIARHYLRYSDIIALENFPVQIPDVVAEELETLYRPWMNDIEKYGEHYEEGTEEMYDGPDFRYEEGFEGHPRFQAVLGPIANLPDAENTSLSIIDYGCAHGHFTNNLAKLFPQHEFIGIDVSPKALQVAEDKAKEWGLENVEYVMDDWLAWDGKTEAPHCDILILGEILEHVPDPVAFMERCKEIVGEAFVIVTTPFGPWEYASYQKDYPKRFHLHHFERADIHDMFSHYESFNLRCLPAGTNVYEELIGWYIYTFDMVGEDVCGRIDYERKYEQTVPKQTASLCVIAKDAQYDLPRLIQSTEPIIDEVVIGVDKATTDETWATAVKVVEQINDNHRSPRLELKVIEIDPAIETGFAAARNETIAVATKQWIIWADCDEEMISGERLWKNLRNNQWRGYGVPQHHFSTEPLGVLSTDYPVRVFRNNEEVRFFGVVHEHPERPDNLNNGVGFAIQIHHTHFSHYGYKTETIRRKRFERNIMLMARDRQENPNRILGKFLWIRDLALMCRFQLEQTKGFVTPDMQFKARQGVELWEKILDENGDHPQTVRMMRDHLEFYDTLTNVLDEGFTFKIKLASGHGSTAPELTQMPELKARFLNKRHLDKFLSVVIDGEVKHYEGKYV